MIRALELENFKGFGKRVRMPFAPITLIFGANSAGKSSILQSLAFLKQSQEGSKGGDQAVIRSAQGYHDFGSLAEILHDHDTAQEMSIGIEVDFKIDQLHPDKPNPQALVRDRDTDRHTLLANFLPLRNAVATRVTFSEKDRNPAIAQANFAGGAPVVPFAQYTPKGGISPVLGAHLLWEAFHRMHLASRTTILQSIERDVQEVEQEIAELTERVTQTERNEPATTLERSSAKRKRRSLPDKAEVDAQRASEELERLEETRETFLQAGELYGHEFDLSAFADFWGDRLLQVPSPANRPLPSHLFMADFVPYFLLDSHFAGAPVLEEGVGDPAALPGVPENAGADSHKATQVRDIFRTVHEALLDGQEKSKAHFRRSLGLGWQTFLPDWPFLTDFCIRQFNACLKSMVPMGPLRQTPSRLYFYGGQDPELAGSEGEHVPDILFGGDESALNLLNDWLDRLQVNYHVKVEPLEAKYADVFELRLIDRNRADGVDVSLCDVGFGVSQILPLVVQSLMARGRILLIEQPEVHLHPALQAELGALFAECSASPYHNQFIIETHSEHLVLRIQRLIREGVLRPEDVSVLYVKRGSSGSEAVALRLDDEGDFIDDWPGGFFPDRLKELL